MGLTKVLSQPEIKEKISLFIKNNFLVDAELSAFGDNDSFLERGIIDSTGVLELVSFIEEAFNVKVQDEELIPDNLDSLHKVTEFVHRKMHAG